MEISPASATSPVTATVLPLNMLDSDQVKKRTKENVKATVLKVLKSNNMII